MPFDCLPEPERGPAQEPFSINPNPVAGCVSLTARAGAIVTKNIMPEARPEIVRTPRGAQLEYTGPSGVRTQIPLLQNFTAAQKILTGVLAKLAERPDADISAGLDCGRPYSYK